MLYKNLSIRVDIPLIKILLNGISIDSQKHSELLKGVTESIVPTKGNQKKCAKYNEILQRVIRLQKETQKMQKVTSDDLLNLNEKLQLLESQLGEEYYVFVQMKTLTVMMKQINQAYNIDLNSVKRIFTSIMSDEERHTELLGTIKKMVTPVEKENNTPLVRFQNPDAWYQPTSSTS
jgi:hypothetical protein